MTIMVNGERRDVGENPCLAEIVAQLTTADRGIAVAVNGTVVPRGEWRNTTLCADDQVEVLTAVQGG